MKFIFLVFSFILLFANQPITIQLNWKYQFEFAGFIIAKEKGFYKDLGIDVTLKELHKNTDVVDFVLKTPNSYGVGDSSLISDIMAGKQLELLMPIYESSPFVLTAINLKLNSLKDIQKYNIILDQFAIKNPAILSMLKSQNIDIDKLNIKKENFYSNIHQKGIFAFYSSNELYTLEKNHITYKTFDPKDYGFDFYGDILFTSKKQLSNIDTTKKIIQATKLGYQYAFSHINETIDIILKKYNTQNLTKEKLLFEANTLKNYISKSFKFNYQKLQNIKNVYILLGFKHKNICIKEYVYTTLKLTPKEKQFLKTHEINAISTATWEPFNVIKNSKLDGIAIDYSNYIQNRIYKHFNCTIAKNWNEVLEGIKNKKYDLTCSTTKTPDREKYALFSKPYVSFPIVIATRNDVGFISNISLIKDKIIAVGKNYTAEKLLKQKYPYLKLLEVKNTDEALKLVSEGKAYAAADILPVIAYKINKYSYANLKISAKTDILFKVRFMIRNDYPELVSIINKVIDTIPIDEKNEIYNKWISVKYQEGYSHQYVNKIFVLITIVGIFIAGLIFYLIKNIYNKDKLEITLKELATMDQLTSIFNRYKIDMALKEQIEISKRYKRELSIIFFDIDHFKYINDTYGHKIGDLVLIELSKLVNKNIRSSDIFGRWGGEEFLIILPETSIIKAEILAEKLRKLIQNTKVGNIDKVTCSFGVTQFRDNDTMETLMQRVDELLYKSKTAGRNKVTKG